MTTMARRLDRLETTISAAADRAIDAWLASLPDADIDVLAEAGERIQAGASCDDLPADLRARYAEVLAAWEVRYRSPEGTP